MAYGTTKVDVIQSSTANVPVQFNDGNGTQIGTLCRAWVNFNGTGTVAIRASFNVSSITDNGTGDYTVNFTTAMPDANYAALCTTETDSTGDGHYMAMNYYSGRTTGSVRVVDKYSSNTSSYDVAYYGVAIFR